MHPVVVVCGLMVMTGVLLAMRWGHLALEPKQPAENPTFADQVKRALWYLDLMVIGGVVSGLVASGAGGRLAMRLLAATAGDSAQGRLTEAEEVVGDITVDGTIGFMIFGGLFFGLASAFVYVLMRKWLPAGRAGALAFGVFLLLVAATRVDPLRADNPDFDIVGPDSVAVAVFVALALFHALVLYAVVGRVGRALPLIDMNPRGLLPYAPLVLLIPTALFGAVIVLVALLGALLSTNAGSRAAWSSRAVMIGGRVVIGLIALVSLPGFVTSMREIL